MLGVLALQSNRSWAPLLILRVYNYSWILLCFVKSALCCKRNNSQRNDNNSIHISSETLKFRESASGNAQVPNLKRIQVKSRFDSRSKHTDQDGGESWWLRLLVSFGAARMVKIWSQDSIKLKNYKLQNSVSMRLWMTECATVKASSVVPLEVFSDKKTGKKVPISQCITFRIATCFGDTFLVLEFLIKLCCPTSPCSGSRSLIPIIHDDLLV